MCTTRTGSYTDYFPETGFHCSPGGSGTYYADEDFVLQILLYLLLE